MIAPRFPKNLLALSFTFLAITGARAATSVIAGNATYIRSNTGQTDQNFGADPQLILGTSTTSIYRVLLSFDLSGVPVDATITSVTLSMNGGGLDGTSVNTSFNLNLYEMTTGFSEGTGLNAGSAGAVNGSASWDNKGPASASWTNGGGDFSSTVLSSAVKNPRTALPAWTFNSTSDFITAADNSAGGTLSLLLKIEDSAENLDLRRVFFLNSDDVATSANRPALTVNFTPAPEPSAALMGLAGLSVLLRRKRQTEV